jgi:hypothetical protein
MDGEDYNTVYRSYDLDQLEVEKEKEDEKCIQIKENIRNRGLMVINAPVKENQ